MLDGCSIFFVLLDKLTKKKIFLLIAEHFQRSEMSRTAGGWLNIHNLEKEREYLKQRQQEIQHQVCFAFAKKNLFQ